MNKYHRIERVEVKDGKLILKVDGQDHTFSLSTISNKLARALQIEREKYQISPSGYGIHWPLIDEDLSIDGLLGISHRPNQVRKQEMVLK